LRVLNNLQIPLSPDYERKLFNLLDNGSSAADIDFLFFSELVGLPYQAPASLFTS